MAGKPVSLALTGIKELDAKLQGMELRSANRVARNTLGAGARTIQKAIKSIAPESLKKSVGLRNEKSRRTGKLETKVGINVGKRGGRTEFKRWAPLLVLGSVQRQRKTLGGKFRFITKPTAEQLSTGQVKGNQIVNRGVSSSKGAARSAMDAAFKRSVAREVAKAKLNKG